MATQQQDTRLQEQQPTKKRPAAASLNPALLPDRHQAGTAATIPSPSARQLTPTSDHGAVQDNAGKRQKVAKDSGQTGPSKDPRLQPTLQQQQQPHQQPNPSQGGAPGAPATVLQLPQGLTSHKDDDMGLPSAVKQKSLLLNKQLRQALEASLESMLKQSRFQARNNAKCGAHFALTPASATCDSCSVCLRVIDPAGSTFVPAPPGKGRPGVAACIARALGWMLAVRLGRELTSSEKTVVEKEAKEARARIAELSSDDAAMRAQIAPHAAGLLRKVVIWSGEDPDLWTGVPKDGTPRRRRCGGASSHDNTPLGTPREEMTDGEELPDRGGQMEVSLAGLTGIRTGNSTPSANNTPAGSPRAGPSNKQPAAATAPASAPAGTGTTRPGVATQSAATLPAPGQGPKAAPPQAARTPQQPATGPASGQPKPVTAPNRTNNTTAPAPAAPGPKAVTPQGAHAPQQPSGDGPKRTQSKPTAAPGPTQRPAPAPAPVPASAAATVVPPAAAVPRGIPVQQPAPATAAAPAAAGAAAATAPAAGVTATAAAPAAAAQSPFAASPASHGGRAAGVAGGGGGGGGAPSTTTGGVGGSVPCSPRPGRVPLNLPLSPVHPQPASSARQATVAVAALAGIPGRTASPAPAAPAHSGRGAGVAHAPTISGAYAWTGAPSGGATVFTGGAGGAGPAGFLGGGAMLNGAGAAGAAGAVDIEGAALRDGWRNAMNHFMHFSDIIAQDQATRHALRMQLAAAQEQARQLQEELHTTAQQRDNMKQLMDVAQDFSRRSHEDVTELRSKLAQAQTDLATLRDAWKKAEDAGQEQCVAILRTHREQWEGQQRAAAEAHAQAQHARQQAQQQAAGTSGGLFRQPSGLFANASRPSSPFGTPPGSPYANRPAPPTAPAPVPAPAAATVVPPAAAVPRGIPVQPAPQVPNAALMASLATIVLPIGLPHTHAHGAAPPPRPHVGLGPGAATGAPARAAQAQGPPALPVHANGAAAAPYPHQAAQAAHMCRPASALLHPVTNSFPGAQQGLGVGGYTAAGRPASPITIELDSDE